MKTAAWGEDFSVMQRLFYVQTVSASGIDRRQQSIVPLFSDTRPPIVVSGNKNVRHFARK